MFLIEKYLYSQFTYHCKTVGLIQNSLNKKSLKKTGTFYFCSFLSKLRKIPM